MARFSGLVSVLLLAAAIGCRSPYLAMPLEETDPAHSQRFHQEKYGIVLAANLLAGAAETRAFFGKPLQEAGIFPLVLHVENQGGRTILLRRDRIRFVLEDGTELTPLDPEQVIGGLRRGPGWGYVGLPLVFPYLFAVRAADRFNFELDRDYRQKSLPGFLRVAPGDPPLPRAIFLKIAPGRRAQLERSLVLEVDAELEALERGRTHEQGRDVRFHLSVD